MIKSQPGTKQMHYFTVTYCGLSLVTMHGTALSVGLQSGTYPPFFEEANHEVEHIPLAAG